MWGRVDACMAVISVTGFWAVAVVWAIALAAERVRRHD